MFLRRILSGGGGLAALRSARAVKQTTGIVGLDVEPEARKVLIGLYTRALDEIKAVPEDEGYRKAVESFTRHRLQICQEEDDWKRIEDRIGCGQVEELIEEAQDELKLIGKMIGSLPPSLCQPPPCQLPFPSTITPCFASISWVYLIWRSDLCGIIRVFDVRGYLLQFCSIQLIRLT
jgi:NADH dehydrogenase (ubiquinone) 1 alpha subcomplex subunit 5